MTTKWKEITQPQTLAVPIALAKQHCRVIDLVTISTQANVLFGVLDSQIFIYVKLSGSFGNQYFAEVVEAGNNTPLSVSLEDTKLTINLATDSGGVSISTVDNVIAALYGNSSCAAVFNINSGNGDGSGILGAASLTQFSNGLDSGEEDSYFDLLISAATQVLENLTNRAFIYRDVRMFLDSWDCTTFPINPVSEVLSVKHLDEVEASNDVTTSFYADISDLDLPSKLILKSTATFPSLSKSPNAIFVDFRAGYGDSPNDIPAKIKQCILFLVAHWYSNREPVINGTAILSNKIPFTFQTTLNSFRMFTV